MQGENLCRFPTRRQAGLGCRTRGCHLRCQPQCAKFSKSENESDLIRKCIGNLKAFSLEKVPYYSIEEKKLLFKWDWWTVSWYFFVCKIEKMWFNVIYSRMKIHSTCIFVNKYYAKTMRTLVLPICILSAERKVFCGFKWHLIFSRAH